MCVSGRFPLGTDLCDVWLAVDAVLMGAVIFHHFMATLDWYQAIKEPLQYKLYGNTKQIWIKIIMAWLLGLIVSILYITLLKVLPPSDNEHIRECGPVPIRHAFVKVITTFCLPCVVTVYIFLLAVRAAKLTANEAKQVHRYAHRLRSGISFDDVCHSLAESENGFIMGNGVTSHGESHHGERPKGKELLNEPLVGEDMVNQFGVVDGLDNPGYVSDKDEVESLSDSIRRGHGSLKRQKAVVEDINSCASIDENKQMVVVSEVHAPSACDENSKTLDSDVNHISENETDNVNNVDGTKTTDTDDSKTILTKEKEEKKCNGNKNEASKEDKSMEETETAANNAENSAINKECSTNSNNTENNTNGLTADNINKDINENAEDNQDNGPNILNNDSEVTCISLNLKEEKELNDNDVLNNDKSEICDKKDCLQDSNTEHHKNDMKNREGSEITKDENHSKNEIEELDKVKDIDVSNHAKDLNPDKTEAEKQDCEEMEKEKQQNEEKTETPNSLDMDNNHSDNNHSNHTDNESESASSTASHHGKKRKKSVRFKSSDGKIVEPAANGSVRGFVENKRLSRLSDIGESLENSPKTRLEFNHIKLDLRVIQALPSDPREYVAQINHAQSLRMSLRLKRHSKMLRVLSLIFFAFVCLYLPYMILLSVFSFCESCRGDIDSGVHAALSWIAISTSMINPFIYILLVPQFRNAFAYSCENVDEDI